VAVTFFAKTFYSGAPGAATVEQVGILSPFSAAFALPLDVSDGEQPDSSPAIVGNLPIFFGYLGWSLLYNVALVVAMMRLFQVRWRVAD
jgi:hypothetical protein